MEVIETERLRLRAIEDKDANSIVELAGDYEVAKMLASVPHPYRRADAQAFMMRLHDQTARGSAFVYAIDREGFIGMIGISEIDVSYGKTTGTLGYWLGRPFWGRGLATEATRALVDHAFRTLEYAELKSGHFKENSRSGRVLAKTGFRYAGEGIKPCLARGLEIPHIEVELTHGQWQDFLGANGRVRSLEQSSVRG